MPKIMITTRPKCSKKLYDFVGDLMQMIPNAFYYPRGTLTVTKMAEYAANKEFTHLVILSEKNKVCNGCVTIDLAYFTTIL
jgi:ribosome production factor 1